ncbi:MAG: aldo/keto reductase [Rhodospirillaceae bacterium]|jgi:aryl-alcohol dehydrogenase-like predicted oxidoreductase|nr:aldo/keto reductase [Rhodospirillaceae bacterium]
MKFNRMGESALMVSELCLGAMMFGEQTDEAEAKRIVDAARDVGVNFIDTANVYAYGESEAQLGRILAGQREDWIIATKVGASMNQGAIDKTNSRKRILMEAERSLTRLQTEYLDIHYLHVDDLATPLDEPVRAMGDLIAAGKVRYWGVSNTYAWRIAEMVLCADALGVPRPIVLQAGYNAVNRVMEQEHLPACQHFGVGFVAYSPLARGILSGKYVPGEAPPEGSRAGRNDPRIMNTEYRDESLDIAQQIKVHAEARGMTAAQFAVKWVLNNAGVASVIGGPRTLDQWQGYIDALAHDFTSEDEALIDGLVPPGFNSTPFYGDPKLPPTGREVAGE